MLKLDDMSAAALLARTILIMLVLAGACLANCFFSTVIANILITILKDEHKKFDVINSTFIVIHAAGTVLAVLILGFNYLTLPI